MTQALSDTWICSKNRRCRASNYSSLNDNNFRMLRDSTQFYKTCNYCRSNEPIPYCPSTPKKKCSDCHRDKRLNLFLDINGI